MVRGHERRAIAHATSVRAIFVATGWVTRNRGISIGTLRRYSAYLALFMT